MNQNKRSVIILVLLGLAVAIGLPVVIEKVADKGKPPAATVTAPAKVSATPGGASATPLPASASPTLAPASATSLAASATPGAPTVTTAPSATASGPTATNVPAATPTSSGAAIAPYPSAPLCLDEGELHDKSLFHTMWDSARGCHYSHEHGISPFTPAMQAVFPNLQAFLGAQIGHTNPSSPCENELGPCGAAIGKHGGFKWYSDDSVPQGCVIGFEGGTVCALAVAIEYHAFGNLAFELDPRVHSLAAAIRQAKPGNLNDTGLVEVIQHVDYGQNVVPYQGDVMNYPNKPVPGYDPNLAPYISTDCVGTKTPQQRGQCRASLQQILDRLLNTNSVWTSKSAQRVAPSGSHLLSILFRVKDTYQVFDWSDQTYPFTLLWLCSGDGGRTYQARAGCPYNNSSTTPHEIQLLIPAAWDNLAGFDTDSRQGRITADGFVTSHGDLAPAGACLHPGATCFPIHMESAFVGLTSTELSAAKVSNTTPADTPDRDIYFCGIVVCSEVSPGAKASGWIGDGN